MAVNTIVINDTKPGNYLYQEAVKTLRANIQFMGKNKKVILVTSAFSNEGKTDISFQLAAEMGKTGKRVLLLDSDIRKSVMKTRFQIQEETVGLSQYLSGQVEEAEHIVYRTNYENMNMILAGPNAPNPSEMLSDESFENLLKRLRQVYDYVIVDTAPLGTVVDAAIVAQHCDGAIMVIESGAVSYRVSQKVKKQLEQSGCRLLGAVLNKADLKNKFYGKYGRYGRYGKYGKYEKYEYYGNTDKG